MVTWSDLTPRKEEILRLVLAGRTNKAMAAEIHVGESQLNSILPEFTKRSACRRACWQASGQCDRA
jgi:FixJ family two-component response regulator